MAESFDVSVHPEWFSIWLLLAAIWDVAWKSRRLAAIWDVIGDDEDGRKGLGAVTTGGGFRGVVAVDDWGEYGGNSMEARGFGQWRRSGWVEGGSRMEDGVRFMVVDTVRRVLGFCEV